MFGRLSFQEILFPKTRLAKIKRKQKFVERLKGPQITVSVSRSVMDGATLTVCNEGTASIIACVKCDGKWYVWGSITNTNGFTRTEFEDFLIEQAVSAQKNNSKLRIGDECGCVTWGEHEAVD